MALNANQIAKARSCVHRATELHDGSEDGGAIVYAVFLSAYIAVFISVVLVGDQLLARTVAAMEIREQTYHDAESAALIMLDRLQINPHWRPTDDTLVVDPRRDTVVDALVQPAGGYFKVVARAQSRLYSCSTVGFAGSPPDTTAEPALQLTRPEKRLFLTGSTTINGDVHIPNGAVETGSIKGERFSGNHAGDVITSPAHQPPGLITMAKTLSALDSLVAGHIPVMFSGFGDQDLADVTFLDKPAVLSGVDFEKDKSAIVITSANLTLENTGRLHDGTLIVSSGVVSINGSVDVGFGMIFGRVGVQVLPASNVSGQLLSRSGITVDQASVSYPSLVYVAAPATIARIDIINNSVIDGTVVFESPGVDDTARFGNVHVDSSSTVRGRIINDGATDLSGTVLGSVVTDRFYFYLSPSSYINWLKDATIDRYLRPGPFYLPAVRGHRLSMIAMSTRCERIGKRGPQT